jgi:DNA (cytosine-5)-methyltransferase 1
MSGLQSKVGTVASPTFVDLFAGAGGLSLGLQQAGWTCKLAVDDWSDAVETYRANIGGHPAVLHDVRRLTGSRLAALLEDRPTWVVGGPPCQGWSTVGKRLWDDDRNDLFTAFMRVVHVLRPDHFLIENVLGLKDMGAIEDVRTLFDRSGYRISTFVMRASDYGVPQLRRRVIFIGSLEGILFEKPPANRSPTSYTTVWDAIGDLPVLEAGEQAHEYDKRPSTAYQRRLRRGSKTIQGHRVSAHPPDLVRAISFVPDGGNRSAIPDEYQPKSGFHNSYSRLNSREPAVAVTSNMGKPSSTRCVHPVQDRGLTAREGARLQSFPDRFHFQGGIVSQRLQIANAVPPMVAEALGRSLVGQIEAQMAVSTRNSCDKELAAA